MLTTENVVKGDKVEFDVAENVVVNDRVVIPKGAVAWGQVTRLKGGGKKLKGAFVAFRFGGVRAADSQEIRLRKDRDKPKKAKPEENEIEESSPILGLRERTIGAEEGRSYAAYTDAEVIVNAPDTPPALVLSPATAPTPAPVAPSLAQAPPQAQSAPPTPAPTPAPAPAPAAKVIPSSLLAPEQGSIDFESDPAGAEIAIDRNVVGNTPSTLRVNPGRHSIEVRLPGYRVWTRSMLIGPGAHPSIRATLEKL